MYMNPLDELMILILYTAYIYFFFRQISITSTF